MDQTPQYNPVPAPVRRQFPLVPVVSAVVGVLVIGVVVWYWQSRSASPSPSVTPTASAQQSSPPGAAAPAQWGQVQFQARQKLSDAPYFPSSPDAGITSEIHWKVGTFTAGPYQGADLVLAQVLYDGPGGPAYYRFAKSGGTVKFLERNSDQYFPGMAGSPFSVDGEYAIGELSPPAVLQSPDRTVTLERGQLGFYSDGLWSEVMGQAHLMEAFTDSQFGEVWTDTVPAVASDTNRPRYGFYIHLPDDTSFTYSLKVPFMSAEGYPSVTFTDHSVGGAYSFQHIGGCGASNFLNVVAPSEIDPAKDLVPGGKTSMGDTIYIFQDSNNRILHEIYNTEYQPIYPSTAKVSYDQFVLSKPLFYWYDSYGRLVQFQNKQFEPQVECGKPVIYLYPTKAEDISVKVAPQGGMTVSDPAYGQGWLVTAQPDGQILDHGTGKTFPYLFWEGRGGIYDRPDKGWVVPQSGVKALIDEKLTAFGLNGHEIADFEEFWLPKMQSAPYYFVTFMGNRAMDTLAPLTIDPKPDTVIRVLMDYQPLQAPKSVQGFAIHAPERKGFTVIEWGGVLGR